MNKGNTVIYHYSVAKEALRHKAIQLHHARYQEVGFFKKNEYDPYEKKSEYFIARNEHDVVGVTRLIFSDLNDLPTLKNFHIYDIERSRIQQLDPEKYAEISAFTKKQQHDVGMGLIKTALQYSIERGITHWICCLDQRVYNYMHRMFKFPFKVIGDAKVYLGSTSIPCVLHLSDCLSTLKQQRPELCDYLCDFVPAPLEVSR